MDKKEELEKFKQESLVEVGEDSNKIWRICKHHILHGYHYQCKKKE